MEIFGSPLDNNTSLFYKSSVSRTFCPKGTTENATAFASSFRLTPRDGDGGRRLPFQ